MLSAIARASASVTSRGLARVASAGLRASSQRAMSTVSLSFVDKDGNATVVKDALIGESLLDIAHENGIDIEGACEGECACSTCHVILESDVFEELPEMSEAEEDMLDLAAGLTDTSRLACQVNVDASFEGAVIRLPDEITNMLD